MASNQNENIDLNASQNLKKNFNLSAKIQVRFITKESPYAINTNVFDINRESSIEDLNNIVNSAIKLNNSNHEDIKFNFLTDGYLINESLDEHLDLILHEKGEEKVIELEYFLVNEPPKPFLSLSYQDWVSCIHANNDYILNGCYDGMINIYSIKKKTHVLSFEAHSNAIKEVKIIDNEYSNIYFGSKKNEICFISASLDETCKIWKWASSEEKVNLLYTCKGHLRSVNGLDVYRDKFVTGSNDNMIKIWKLEDENFSKSKGQDNSKKKVKNIESSIKNPYTTLAGHSDGINDVCWMDENSNEEIPDLASCSLDSTIKIWDTKTLELKSTLYGPKAFLSLDYSSKTKSIISSLCDKYIRLFDPRAKEGSIVKSAYSSHTNWISSVKWLKDSDYLFVSGSFDFQVKKWDLRSTKAPLYNLVGHNGRVLTVDWSNPNFICSGGSDSFMKIFITST